MITIEKRTVRKITCYTSQERFCCYEKYCYSNITKTNKDNAMITEPPAVPSKYMQLHFSLTPISLAGVAVVLELYEKKL